MILLYLPLSLPFIHAAFTTHLQSQSKRFFSSPSSPFLPFFLKETDMSQLGNSKSHFSTLVFSDLILLCSFILSHPLYFSYFIFFAPYLLKLISFLSPLFLTTSLLSLTGFVYENFSTESAQTSVTHLLTGCSSLLEKLRFKRDFRNDEVDDLGIYEILFESSAMEVRESSIEFSQETPADGLSQCLDRQDLGVQNIEDFADNKVEINSIPGDKLQNSCPEVEEKRLDNFLKILDEFERMSSNVEEKKRLEPSRGSKSDKVVEKPKVEQLLSNGSEAAYDQIKDAINGGEKHTPMVKAHSQRITTNVDHVEGDRKSSLKAESSRALMEVNSYGSMRKEKEWKRTLACKLFEERHNVDGGEGMDSLWETYEMDSDKATMKQKNEEKKKLTKIKKNKNVIDKYEEDEEIDGQLCCLQALKLSAGKLNLGMGRPNLVKISKAIKGFGWLHHVSKHSKKVHNNGDRY